MRIGSEVEMIESSAESMLSIFRVGACADAGFTNIAAAPVTAANSSICRREKLPAFMIVPPLKIWPLLYALSYPSSPTVGTCSRSRSRPLRGDALPFKTEHPLQSCVDREGVSEGRL